MMVQTDVEDTRCCHPDATYADVIAALQKKSDRYTDAAVYPAAVDAINFLLAENERLAEALEFYADPASYFAIAFIPDPPCGEFMDDFSDDHGDGDFPGYRAGKRARAALAFAPQTATPDDRTGTPRSI